MTHPTEPSILPRDAGRRRFITLRSEHSREEVDLEMPSDRPIGQVMPDLLKVISWPAQEGEQALRYALRTESGRALQEGETLAEAGVENSDVLWIQLVDQPLEPTAEVASRDASLPTAPQGDPTSGFSPVLAPIASPGDRRGTLTPRRPAGITLGGPSLVNRGGLIFLLGQPPITIGRASPGFRPAIDLTEIDPEFVSSRRHAEIHLVDGNHVLIARPTTNGTFINGAEARPGERSILRDGDLIQFGFGGVELIFFSDPETTLDRSLFD